MTFCIGIKVKDGLVGIADTRITSGSEYITARKMTLHQHGRHSMFLTTSGLRGARDKALTYFEEVLEESDETFDKLYKAVNAFAEQIRRVAREDKEALADAGLPFNIHALVGGQLERDKEHKLYLLYPQGNWVEVSKGSPYFVIGEGRYGKPLLDRALTYESSIEDALKAGYLAFDATRASSADVGYPLDVAVYRRDTFHFVEHRYHKGELDELSQWWHDKIVSAFDKAPNAWAKTVLDKLDAVNGAPV
ncbi:MAG: peptidase [Phycisphaeraceae bacterium]|nr:MAG: peptidase [Phycisphaeraceae bacterium]